MDMALLFLFCALTAAGFLGWVTYTSLGGMRFTQSLCCPRRRARGSTESPLQRASQEDVRPPLRAPLAPAPVLTPPLPSARTSARRRRRRLRLAAPSSAATS